MTAHGVVVTLLLLFPWVLIAVGVAGAAWSTVAHRLACRGKGRLSVRERVTSPGPGRHSNAGSLGNAPVYGSRVTRYPDHGRRAA